MVDLDGWVLWNINRCWLFNIKSCLYKVSKVGDHSRG